MSSPTEDRAAALIARLQAMSDTKPVGRAVVLETVSVLADLLRESRHEATQLKSENDGLRWLLSQRGVA